MASDQPSSAQPVQGQGEAMPAAPHPDSAASRLSSSGTSISLSSEGFGKKSYIQNLKQWIPTHIGEYSWELQNEIAKVLNPLIEPRGNDWRLVASRLNFEAKFIDTIKSDTSPTLTLLKNCTDTSTHTFLGILADATVDRMDVIRKMMEYVNNSAGMRERSPTQESVVSVGWSSPSSSFDKGFGQMPRFPSQEDSGIENKMSRMQFPSVGRQPSEQDAEDEAPPHVDFLKSEESKSFWESIPGEVYGKKKWKDFHAALKNSDFSDELKGGVDKFLCIVLRIDHVNPKELLVNLDDFIHLIAWFGPLRKGGCLTKIYKLMQGSISRSADSTKQSWFAGYMTETESEKGLKDQSPGCFLIRFSTSRADDGYFVLAVKTDDDVQQFQIEGNPESCTHLTLAGQTYSDLLELVDDLRRNIRLEHCRQLLTNPCPNLPLNAIFKGYTQSSGIPPARRGRGRGGRGRGRGNAQS